MKEFWIEMAQFEGKFSNFGTSISARSEAAARDKAIRRYGKSYPYITYIHERRARV